MLKLHLGSIVYCAILISMNWWWSAKYAREVGITAESVSPVALAVLFSAGVALYLACRCAGLAANLLFEGRRIAAGKWVLSWSVLIYTLPLLWTNNSTSVWRDADGAFVTETGGYGHPSSQGVFLFAVAGLLLFQILVRLNSGGANSGRPADSAPTSLLERQNT